MKDGCPECSAGIAETPETSAFTSIQQRIREWSARRSKRTSTPTATKPRLLPLTRAAESAHACHFSFSLESYMELVDWAGRAVRADKRGAIGAHVPPILERLHIDPDHYLRFVQRGGRDHHIAALGHIDRLREAVERLGRCFVKGMGRSRQLYSSAV